MRYGVDAFCRTATSLHPVIKTLQQNLEKLFTVAPKLERNTTNKADSFHQQLLEGRKALVVSEDLTMLDLVTRIAEEGKAARRQI